MTTTQKVLLCIFAAFAALFIALIPLKPYPGDFFIKAIPAISLAALAFIAVSGTRGKLLFASLLLCATADIALELPIEMSFILGLALFLIAHIVFIITFSRDFKMQRPRIPIIVLIAIYGLGMAFVLTPWLKEMAIPVYTYITAITLMAIFAALRSAKNMFTLYGAISFIVSDSIIAINRFVVPVVVADYIIMVTYYVALFLIVYGLLKE